MKAGRKKGSIPWNKGLSGEEYISHYNNKMQQTEEHIKKRADANRGSKRSESTKQKMRDARIKYVGEHCFDNGFRPSIDKYETNILDFLEKSFNYNIIRQHRVAGYFIDGYCPMLNLVIEIDEPHHNKPEQLKRDTYREEIIKNKLECSFLRIPVRTL